MKRLIIELLICIGLGAWLMTRLSNKVNDIELLIFLGVAIYFMVVIVKIVIWYIKRNVNFKMRK